jgi:hypothetical protein
MRVPPASTSKRKIPAQVVQTWHGELQFEETRIVSHPTAKVNRAAALSFFSPTETAGYADIINIDLS